PRAGILTGLTMARLISTDLGKNRRKSGQNVKKSAPGPGQRVADGSKEEPRFRRNRGSWRPGDCAPLLARRARQNSSLRTLPRSVAKRADQRALTPYFSPMLAACCVALASG